MASTTQLSQTVHAVRNFMQINRNLLHETSVEVVDPAVNGGVQWSRLRGAATVLSPSLLDKRGHGNVQNLLLHVQLNKAVFPLNRV